MPDDIVEPYDVFFGDFTQLEKEEWWKVSSRQLLENFSENTVYHFYAGQNYIKGIIPVLQESGRQYECYLNNLRVGYKTQWFKQHTKNYKKKLF